MLISIFRTVVSICEISSSSLATFFATCAILDFIAATFEAGFEARLEAYHDVYANLLGANPDDINYENNILLYDAEVTGQMRARQMEYIADSNEVTIGEVSAWPWRRRLWNNVMAIVSPVL